MKGFLSHFNSAVLIFAALVFAIATGGSAGQKSHQASVYNSSHYSNNPGSHTVMDANFVSGPGNPDRPTSFRRSLLPRSVGTITVNTTTDEQAVDPTLSDTAADGKISVRSAIQYTNAQPGQDTIVIPNGTYYLTVAGKDEDTSATGDFDINDSLVIMGTSEGGTELYGGIDRVLDIGPANSNIAVTISKLTITQGRTKSGESGGGICVHGGAVTLDTVDVVFNASTVNGGGIEILNGTFAMNGGGLSYNTAALDGSGSGGGADVEGGAAVFNNVTIMKDVATAGAGIQTWGSAASITLSYCTLSQDSTVAFAGGSGGAFGNGAGSFTMDHCTISSCYGDGRGGAIDVEDGVNSITNSRFESNSSSLQGGAIWNGATLSMSGDTIANNGCGGGGDAGGIESQGQLTIIGGVVSHNSCDGNGGGLHLGAFPDTLSGVAIVGNLSGTSGGGIFDSDCPTLYLSNVTIDSNTAEINGGGIEDDHGGIYWAGGSLSYNSAATSGGGLYFNAADSNDTLNSISLRGNSPDNIYDNTGGAHQVVQIDVSLSVQLNSFTAASDAESVTLTWLTASEVKNAGFLVEKQQPGMSGWQLAGSYKTDKNLEGLGTSSSGRSYSFTDDKVVSGETYNYKIQSVSTDGTTKDLSTLSVTVDVPKNFALYQNFPNPFNPTTTIRFDLDRTSSVTLEIYNALGQRVLETDYGTMNAGRYDKSVNMENFASGVYLYRLVASAVEPTNANVDNGQKFVSIKKLVLMK